MKQLIILSGKGGTGKTTLTACFAHLASEGNFSNSLTIADADVDASNLELILEPEKDETNKFPSGQTARIDQKTCAACGRCQAVCRFDAVEWMNDHYQIDSSACEGCAACLYQCSTDSISMQDEIAGETYVSDTPYGKLFHAHLYPGQENSGKLVSMVRQKARLSALEEKHQLVLVDGPPGIGCPVISALTGADLALIVAEPTAAGAHDIDRALETASHFGVRALVCINKADLHPEGTEAIKQTCRERGIKTIGEIPFDLTAAEALINRKAVSAFNPSSAAAVAIHKIWAKTAETLFENESTIQWIEN